MATKTKPKKNSAGEAPDRAKATVYLDKDPDVQKMILRATKADGRVFSYFAVTALREWLLKHGYGDNQWKGPEPLTVK